MSPASPMRCADPSRGPPTTCGSFPREPGRTEVDRKLAQQELIGAAARYEFVKSLQSPTHHS